MSVNIVVDICVISHVDIDIRVLILVVTYWGNHWEALLALVNVYECLQSQQLAEAIIVMSNLGAKFG